MGQIVDLGAKKKFTLDQANLALPLIFKITKDSSVLVKNLVAQIESGYIKSEEHKNRLELEVNDLVVQWQSKVERLGATPKGIWIVDFDSGDGYYCWKYPELKVSHWHGYQDGFTGRVSLMTPEQQPGL